MNRNDGGPAFPTTPDCYENMDPAGAGMTLRDYFAAKAMAGIRSNEAVMREMVAIAAEHGISVEDVVSSHAYGQADAMLKWRKE